MLVFLSHSLRSSVIQIFLGCFLQSSDFPCKFSKQLLEFTMLFSSIWTMSWLHRACVRPNLCFLALCFYERLRMKRRFTRCLGFICKSGLLRVVLISGMRRALILEAVGVLDEAEGALTLSNVVRKPYQAKRWFLDDPSDEGLIVKLINLRLWVFEA